MDIFVSYRKKLRRASRLEDKCEVLERVSRTYVALDVIVLDFDKVLNRSYWSYVTV